MWKVDVEEGGYIKISELHISQCDYIKNIIEKIGSKMSQSNVDIYLKELLRYNILDANSLSIISSALSENSLKKV